MKKILATLLFVTMLSFFSVSYAETYSASAKGFAGDVTVALDIEGSAIVGVDIQGPNETSGIGSVAIERMASDILRSNRVDIDSVAGATYTSEAILTAAAQALADSGATLTPVAVQEAAVESKEDEYTDVLVLGGGAGGLSASSAAAEAGAKVILVEKLPFLGGSAAISGGVFTRPAMPGDEGEVMDTEELYQFLMETAENKADADIVRNYIDKSCDTYTWLYESMIGSYEGIYRYPMMPEFIVAIALPGGGSELINHMSDYAYKVGVDVRLDTAAVELIEEDGEVTGAIVRNSDGSQQKIFAEGGVVLATGGFAYSPEMLAKYSTYGAEQIASSSGTGTVGDGLVMAEKVGASVRFNDDWDNSGGPSAAFTFLADNIDQGQFMYMVLINDKGERFMNEASGQPEMYRNMRKQFADGSSRFWFIVNDQISNDTEWICESAGGFTAQTLEEVAEKLEIPYTNLQKSIEEYDACAGTDGDAYGKPAEYNKGMAGPYTVFPVAPIRVLTIGGLSITTDAEVLDTNGIAIPGLYATGEVANYNFFYQTYTCGTAIGHAITYGRVAGTNAAAAAK